MITEKKFRYIHRWQTPTKTGISFGAKHHYEIAVLQQTRSWCFSHLYCEEMGSYQAAKVHVMCSQEPNQHKSRSKVCSYWIVIPQNTCQN